MDILIFRPIERRTTHQTVRHQGRLPDLLINGRFSYLTWRYLPYIRAEKGDMRICTPKWLYMVQYLYFREFQKFPLIWVYTINVNIGCGYGNPPRNSRSMRRSGTLPESSVVSRRSNKQRICLWTLRRRQSCGRSRDDLEKIWRLIISSPRAHHRPSTSVIDFYSNSQFIDRRGQRLFIHDLPLIQYDWMICLGFSILKYFEATLPTKPQPVKVWMCCPAAKSSSQVLPARHAGTAGSRQGRLILAEWTGKTTDICAISKLV